jgi:hypothetical protein
VRGSGSARLTLPSDRAIGSFRANNRLVLRDPSQDVVEGRLGGQRLDLFA